MGTPPNFEREPVEATFSFSVALSQEIRRRKSLAGQGHSESFYTARNLCRPGREPSVQTCLEISLKRLPEPRRNSRQLVEGGKVVAKRNRHTHSFV